MSELRPYSPPTDVPLTAGARFIRGFKRIGLVFGAIAMVCGVRIGAFVAVDQQRAENSYAQATCLNDEIRFGRPLKMQTYDASIVDTIMSGCYGPLYSETLASITTYAQRKPAPMEYMIEPLYYAA